MERLRKTSVAAIGRWRWFTDETFPQARIWYRLRAPGQSSLTRPGVSGREKELEKMKATLLKDFRKISSANGRYITMGDLVQSARDGTAGKLVWDECRRRDRMAELCASWPGWPACQCSCCGCDEPAVTTDDGGNAACEACADYTCDDDGCVVCSRSGLTETVVVSCGAGSQTRSYVRRKPPEMPESDGDGAYCMYWESVGNDACVISRYATRAEAEQAVAATDWPRPGDNTNYLCGYSVRQFRDGEWMPLVDQD